MSVNSLRSNSMAPSPSSVPSASSSPSVVVPPVSPPVFSSHPARKRLRSDDSESRHLPLPRKRTKRGEGLPENIHIPNGVGTEEDGDGEEVIEREGWESANKRNEEGGAELRGEDESDWDTIVSPLLSSTSTFSSSSTCPAILSSALPAAVVSDISSAPQPATIFDGDEDKGNHHDGVGETDTKRRGKRKSTAISWLEPSVTNLLISTLLSLGYDSPYFFISPSDLLSGYRSDAANRLRMSKDFYTTVLSHLRTLSPLVFHSGSLSIYLSIYLSLIPYIYRYT
jgi:hypothetical protein